MISKITLKNQAVNSFMLFFLVFLYFTGTLKGTTVTMGSGTGTSQVFPLSTYYGYSYTQQIYTQAQINTFGNIQKIRFYYVSGGTTNSSAWVIYMGHTSKTAFSNTTDWVPLASMTKVFESSVTFPGAAGWMEITLSTPFAYNNTDNLVIAVDENTSGYAGSVATWYKFTSGSNTGIYYRNDSNNPDPSSPPTATGTSSEINQIQLEIDDPTPMSIASSTTEQGITTPVFRGTNNQEVIRLKVVTTGAASPINLTSITFNTSGTTNTADLLNARVFYTNTTTFSSSEQFGSVVSSPGGTLTFNGSKILTSGDNYFWLAYDINVFATEGNFIDGQCTAFLPQDGGGERFPGVTSPAGNRTIRDKLAGIKIITATGGDYTNFISAIADLNLVGVGEGGVIFQIPDGETFNEVAPLVITATGTSSNNITFRQSGSGTRPIVNVSGTSGGEDAAFRLDGCDFIILEGLDIRDAGQVTGGTDDDLEIGIYLKGKSDDGCRNNLVKNCIIDMNNGYVYSWGVYVYSQATSDAGKNINNLFYNNTVQDCYMGYWFRGMNASYYDSGNEVGNADGGTSVLTNIGSNLGNTVYGVRMQYNQNFKVFNTSFSSFNNDFAIAAIFQEAGGANSASYYGNTMNDFLLTVYSNEIIGIKINEGNTHNIYSNHIYGFTTATGDVIGIAIAANSSTNSIYKNNIHDLSYTGTSYMQVMGIKSYNGSTNNIYNNFIYDLRAPSAIPHSGLSRYTNVTGIYLRSGGNYVFYNSVLINYTSTAASNESAALFLSSNASTVDLRNNIFVNNTDVTTGTRAVTIYRDNTTITNLSSNSNNNIYYAGTPSAKNLIFYDRTNSDQTIAAYKTRMVTKDQNSVTENVPFVSPAGTYDLHINPATPTQVEGGALVVTSPFAVTDDVDGNLRSGTFPDIGADEGSFTVLDLSPPVITYTALSNTSLITDRVLTTTITDVTGVPTSGPGLPMLYWKINSGSWTGVQGVSVGSNQFTFTFGAGVILADVVSYYVVAQDNATAKSVTCYPLEGASGFSVDPPAVSTPPTTPSTYTVINSISGEIFVGDGQTFTSLSQTGGVFDAINQRIITGNITIKITSNLIETGAVSLNRQTEEALYSISIQPDAAVERVISGTVNQGMIKFNGAQNVTIDGRFEGSGNYLTFDNYRTNNPITIQLISVGAGLGCNNVTIRNCNIRTGTMGSSGISPVNSYAIQLGNVSSGSAGADNDNISIIDNIITKALYGILVKGAESGVNNNLIITGNTIGSQTTTSSIRKYGILLEYCTGATVSQNTIFNVLDDGGSPYGIIINPGVTNSSIERNKINSVKPTSMTTTYGGRGIMLNTSTSSSNIKVANNIMYDILGGSSTSFSGQYPTVGIYLASGGGYKIYYNSVNLTGSANRNAATISTGFYAGSSVTDVDLRNNIFVNGIINTSNTGDKAYSIYSDAPNSSFTNINYNDYYVYTGGSYAGVLGYFGGDVTSLADWRTASGQDVNSISANPDFMSDTELSPLSGSPVLAAGTPVSGLTTDYYGNPRSGTNPSVGAVENAYVYPELDWVNLQHPQSFTIKEGIVGQSVYARAYEPGVTDQASQGAGIQCWIGYSTSNTNPDTWTNWVSAAFQGDAGNNDEYTATLGTNFAAGTYYYASRWLLSGALDYQYGGYSSGGGGFWDGTTYVSGVLTVEDNSIAWGNLQFPQSATIFEGGGVDIFARVYVPDVTTLATISPSIACWIGINTDNTDPSTWPGGVWEQADFNVHSGNNDEYMLNTGSELTPGTYYYASRFRLANDSYVYGGYSSGGGNFWDGTNFVSGVLTVNQFKLSPPFSESFESGLPPLNWGKYDGILASPSVLMPTTYGWYQTPWRNNLTSGFGDAAQVNIYSNDDFYWLVTPTINLGTGAINYELRFDLSLNAYATSDPPELTGTDDKLAVVISTDNGETWSAANTLRLWDNAGSPYVYNNISNNGTFTKIAIPLTGYTGDVKIGFYGESTLYNADNDVFVDNVEVRKIPNTSNTQTINAGVLEPLGFTGTGITLQFPAGNSTDLNLTIDKIEGNAGGTLPGGLLNLGLVYWNVTVNSGTVNGVYCFSADVSECGTVTNYATLHLLKRNNATSDWVDIGVPTDISGAPILKWCYPELNSFSEFGIAGFSENPLPVELASFTALVSGRDVTLNWATKTEVSSNRFVVERSLSSHLSSLSGHSLWETVGEVKASGNSNSPKEYSFTDKKLNSGQYNYRLKMIDNDGTFNYSEIVEAEIDVPKTFALNQNYPNPFNPATVISYQLPVNSLVKLELFSITGEKVATLVNEELEAGYHNYNLSATSLGLSSGVYIYRMIAGGFVSTKKLMLIK